MLITFQSNATPDVLMLKDLAGYLLGIVGKRLNVRGVITHDELPHVISRLETAISEDEKAAAEDDALHRAVHTSRHEHHAGLSQRAYPFLDMLREAHKQNADIIWGL
jgi:Domain of unknown function (DUF1840)